MSSNYIGLPYIGAIEYDPTLTVEMLDASPDYKYHHTGSCRGYLSRKQPPRVVPYKGKYGEGYKVYHPRWDTTQYVSVSYYIKVK